MAYNHHHIYLEHLAHDHNSSLLYIVQGSPLPSMLSQTDLGIGNHRYQHWGEGGGGGGGKEQLQVFQQTVMTIVASTHQSSWNLLAKGTLVESWLFLI